MKIDLFQDLAIPEQNPTIEIMLENFFQKSERFLRDFQAYVHQNKLEQVVVPQFNEALSLEMKREVVLAMLVLHELTTSPVFLLHAEFFCSNEKLSSFDTLFFLFGLIKDKLDNNYPGVFSEYTQRLDEQVANVNQLNIVYDVQELAHLK